MFTKVLDRQTERQTYRQTYRQRERRTTRLIELLRAATNRELTDRNGLGVLGSFRMELITW